MLIFFVARLQFLARQILKLADKTATLRRKLCIWYLFVATSTTRECLWKNVYAVGELQLQSVDRLHYSDENISSLTCSPVPEILYNNRPGVFSDFMVLNVTYG